MTSLIKNTSNLVNLVTSTLQLSQSLYFIARGFLS
jgi:hypothetical protein